MIIHQPETIEQDGYVIIWARLELKEPQENFPKYLWYRVPDQYASYLTLQSDAFLVPALLAGMHFGEDIDVRGTVSPKLAYNLEEYQFLLNLRMPNAVKPVSIKYAQLKQNETKPKRNTILP